MAKLTLQSALQTLNLRGLTPRSRLARFCATMGLITGVWALAGVHGYYLPYTLALLLFLGSLLILAVRAFMRSFMWRLRNRLIVTYVFIAVIPIVLLATIGIFAGYLLAGQFSTFVVTTDLRNELQRLETANRTITHEAAGALRRNGTLQAQQLSISNEAFPERVVTAYYRGRTTVLFDGSHAITPPPGQATEASIILDNGELFFRAVNRARVSDVPGDEVVVVSSVPLDRKHLETVVANMGRVDVYGESASESVAENRRTSVNLSGTSIDISSAPKITSGTVPPPVSRFDVELSSFVSVQNVIHWQSGAAKQLLLTVRTRPSLLYNRLFRTLGELSNIIYIILAGLAILFALIEVVSLVIGVSLTRTMTSSVAKLYDATRHVNKGDFTHRIEVSAKDQLASLETSFNSMTASIEKLIGEQKEKQRIESELFIAKEVQDLLFPRDAADLDGLELHGICRPARTVSGDYYDFLPVGSSAVGLAVGDISGKGISAALMMATVHAFVRAHTMTERVPVMAASAGSSSAAEGECCPAPGTVLAMLNQQLYRNTPAQKYATMVLGFYDQQSRQFNYSNAGHLPPIVICADGTTQRLEVGGTVVGLFGDMAYPEGRITLNPGDILVAYSDGITEPENDFGDFGEDRLVQIVMENRSLALPRISEAILNAVTDWIGGEEQPDDMTIVLARAR
jgi:sigma-B regulation protein RsbU (phosphoserine phosphatase)